MSEQSDGSSTWEQNHVQGSVRYVNVDEIFPNTGNLDSMKDWHSMLSGTPSADRLDEMNPDTGEIDTHEDMDSTR